MPIPVLAASVVVPIVAVPFILGALWLLATLLERSDARKDAQHEEVTDDVRDQRRSGDGPRDF